MAWSKELYVWKDPCELIEGRSDQEHYIERYGTGPFELDCIHGYEFARFRDISNGRTMDGFYKWRFKPYIPTFVND